MFVAGIDAHATYSVIAIVSNTGQLVAGPIRIKNTQEDRLNDLLGQYLPLEVVVETSPAWPWLFDRLKGNGIHFVLAHAKRLRVIAESNYKSDDIDAELLARMRLAGLIPEVHPKCPEQREQAVLLRNRARLVRERTRMVNPRHDRWVRCGEQALGHRHARKQAVAMFGPTDDEQLHRDARRRLGVCRLEIRKWLQLR